MKQDKYWGDSKFRTDDKVTDGYQQGLVTGRPMEGYIRVYWNSGRNMYNETIPESSIQLIDAPIAQPAEAEDLKSL